MMNEKTLERNQSKVLLIGYLGVCLVFGLVVTASWMAQQGGGADLGGIMMTTRSSSIETTQLLDTSDQAFNRLADDDTKDDDDDEDEVTVSTKRRLTRQRGEGRRSGRPHMFMREPTKKARRGNNGQTFKMEAFNAIDEDSFTMPTVHNTGRTIGYRQDDVDDPNGRLYETNNDNNDNDRKLKRTRTRTSNRYNNLMSPNPVIVDPETKSARTVDYELSRTAASFMMHHYSALDKQDTFEISTNNNKVRTIGAREDDVDNPNGMLFEKKNVLFAKREQVTGRKGTRKRGRSGP